MVPKFKLSNDQKFDATSASTAVGGPSVDWLARFRTTKAVVPPAQASPSGRAWLRRLDVNSGRVERVHIRRVSPMPRTAHPSNLTSAATIKIGDGTR
jgi:hypothetical protein